MSAMPVEVRKCPSCDHPAVVLVMEWQHTMYGGSTGESTKEYRCQDCGAWQVRSARSRVIAFWIVGALLSIPCLFGAPFLFLAWRQHTFDQRVPIVPGVPAPRMRFPGGAPRRTCGKCNAVAKTTQITRNTHKGIPTGTEYEYACTGCGLQFTTENFLGHAFSTFGGLLLAAIGASFFFGSKDAAWRYGGSGLMALLAVFLLGQSGVRLMNRLKHKELVENVL